MQCRYLLSSPFLHQLLFYWDQILWCCTFFTPIQYPGASFLGILHYNKLIIGGHLLHFRILYIVALLDTLLVIVYKIIACIQVLPQLLGFYSSTSHIILRFQKIAASIEDLDLNEPKFISINLKRKTVNRQKFLSILREHNDVLATVPPMLHIFSLSIFVSFTFSAFILALNLWNVNTVRSFSIM